MKYNDNISPIVKSIGLKLERYVKMYYASIMTRGRFVRLGLQSSILRSEGEYEVSEYISIDLYYEENYGKISKDTEDLLTFLYVDVKNYMELTYEEYVFIAENSNECIYRF